LHISKIGRAVLVATVLLTITAVAACERAGHQNTGGDGGTVANEKQQQGNASEAGAEADAKANLTLKVDAGSELYPINPLFFGANTLFWIDDDASMKDGEVAAQMKDLQVKLLRYPGGTVADNFHWQDVKLDRTDRFPYEDGPDKMSPDEFIALCRKVGAEPMIVVNTETWFAKGDVEGGAKEAADWVRYYNKEKGYGVKYWEIGNETYHHPIMSAEEYAGLVVQYSKAMKQVDPSIQIGVNGHWNAKDVGTKERVKPGKLQELLAAEESASGKQENDKLKQLEKQLIDQDRLKGSPMWWPTVLDKAGESLDFAIIHWYFTPNQVKNIDTAVRELDQLIQGKLPGKHIPIALTEWNSTQERNVTTEANHALMIGEAMLRFLDGGVDMSEYWPFRMKSGKFTMLDYKTNNPGSFANLFKLLASSLQGDRVAASGLESQVYSFAARDKATGKLVVCLINRTNADLQGVAIDLQGFQANKASGKVLATQTVNAKSAVLKEQDAVLAKSEGQWTVGLPKLSMAVVQFE
jgi:alpha-L-arabinofuranosidase